MPSQDCSKLERVQVHLRLDPDVHEKLKRIAERKSRNLNQHIREILNKYLRDYQHLIPLALASVWLFSRK